MEMDLFKIVHSLNVVTQVPMAIVDDSGKIISKYSPVNEEIDSILIRNILNEYDKRRFETFSIKLTTYDDLYITFKIKESFLICGPFCYRNFKNTSAMGYFKFKTNKTYNLRYSFSDLREFIFVAQSMLEISDEYPFEKEVLNLSASNLKHIKQEYATDIQKINLDSALVRKDYEDALMEQILTGDVDKVIEISKKLSNAITPDLSNYALRSEKNYSILIFEKLSHATIDIGCPEKDALYLRDYYIKENEKLQNALEVLELRNAAIIIFTKLVQYRKINAKTNLIKSVINYIHNNITMPLKVSDIAEKFSINETTLRKRFKSEIKTTLSQYIVRTKVEKSKNLLIQGYSVSEVANMLGFYDSAHFSKAFKKHLGIAPNVYKLQFSDKNI